MKPQTIIFIGPQGSGKGTQVERVTAHLKDVTSQPVTNIETGRAFRQLATEGGYTAERVKELLAEGKMIPNFITKAFVVKFLIRNITPETHLTMDGFPRNEVQVKFIDDLMAFYKREGLTVVFLDTPEDVVRERMAGRGRNDDTPELIDERLRNYREQTLPIVQAYEARADINFIKVDGTLSINDVTKTIIAGLNL
jgi:adenylate kinase